MRLTPTLIALMSLTLVACGDKDSDGDGLLDSEEAELGTDPDLADTDGDGLNDDVEVANGSDPTLADSDGDGLEDADEAELGTDANSADTDGDGLEDGEEVELGTDATLADSDGDGVSDGDEVEADSDPTNQWSWPGDGVWPDFSGNMPAPGTGYAMDAVFPEMTGADRNGNSVSLSNFYGSVILLDFSAGWCGPCQVVARDAENMWNEHRDEGFVIIHAMTDGYDYGEGTTDAFVGQWADAYGITFPVLHDGNIYDTYYGLYQAGLNEGYVPYMMVLDRELKLRNIYVGGGNESAIESVVETYLAE